MAEGNGVTEENRARVIGIAVTLDDLGAGERYVFPRDDRERRGAEVGVCLRHVEIMIRSVGRPLRLADGSIGSDRVRILAAREVEQSAEPLIGRLGKLEIERVEHRLVALEVEDPVV